MTQARYIKMLDAPDADEKRIYGKGKAKQTYQRTSVKAPVSFDCQGCNHRYPRYTEAVSFRDTFYCLPCYDRYVRVCVVCSGPFFTKTNNKKTCSNVCILANEKAKARERASRRDITFHFGENEL